MKTHDEFKRFMFDTENAARYTANEFMRIGRSKWIARALQEGWSDVLRHLAYQIAKKDVLKYGDLPTIDRLNGIVINKEDHYAFKTIGASKRITGDAA